MRLVKQAERHSKLSDDICREDGEEPHYYKCTNCGGIEMPYYGSLAQSLTSCTCDNRNMVKIYKR